MNNQRTRPFRILGAVVLLVTLVTACGETVQTETPPEGAQDVGQLVIASFGGALDQALKKAYVEPFTAETGIEVTLDPTSDFGKAKAMVESGSVEWDIYMAPDRIVPAAVRAGILEPLDWQMIGKPYLLPEAVHDYAAGAYAYSTAMAYHHEVFGDDYPHTWADFWNVEAYPGPRSLRRHPIDNLEWALLADGVSPDQLYPIDMDRAFASLDKIRPYVTVWWETGAQSVQVLADKEAVIGSAWNGRVAAAQAGGVPLEINWHQAILHWDFWTVLKGAANRDNAMRFIEFALDAKRQADFTAEIPYAPASRKAFDYIPDDVAIMLPTDLQNYKQAIPIDLDWWGENLDIALERFAEWLPDE
jgi:putative spermidine/putrescine transport system substrate-binding protein